MCELNEAGGGVGGVWVGKISTTANLTVCGTPMASADMVAEHEIHTNYLSIRKLGGQRCVDTAALDQSSPSQICLSLMHAM